MPMPTGRLMRQGPWGLPDWAWQALTHWGSPPQRSQIRGWPVSGFPRMYLAGQASAHSVLWLFAWGDAGTQAAAKNGGLTVIHNADDKDLVILGGVYARRTTIVYGD